MIWTEKTVDIKKLKPSEYNPRKISDHDYGALKRSLKEFGHAYPMICNKDLTVIGGHQTLKAAKELGWKKIKISLPDKQIPPEKEKALNLALNRIHGDWQEDKLQIILKELYDSDTDIELTGFEETEIDGILKELYEGEEEEEIPIPPKEPKAKRGDIYQLGSHRLMCGDSAIKLDVELLMDGGGANMVFTDPPYGVDYDQSTFKDRHRGEGRNYDKIIGDNLKGRALTNFSISWLKAIKPHLTKNYSAYIFFGDKTRHHLMNALDELKIHYAVPLTWIKNNSTITWDRYHPKHESIVYCGPGSVPTGKNSRWYGPKNETTVWEHNIPTSGTAVHPTQKPVDLIIRAIKNSSKKQETILDPFGGSGSTLIACEQTQRTCYMMEISEAYIDVIIERFENYSNKKAVKIN